MSMAICDWCGTPIDTDEDEWYFVPEDGTFACENCYMRLEEDD